ncbi:MAG: DUF92 domain-containing protein [Alkalicoccus sp.]|nr:MAG: DUF92 domain-containing protein [Alkalicoccus sp.]
MSLFLYMLTAAVAFGAWRTKSLTSGGALAAFIVGGLSVAGFGFTGMAVMGSFFFSSVLLEKALKSEDKKEAKGATRDAVQVMANGGAASACAVLQFFFPHPVLFIGFTAAYAAAAADTWASALGRKSTEPPVSIKTGRLVEPGISGGVTRLGNLAAGGGSGFVTVAALLLEPEVFSVVILVLLFLTAFLSQFADAWLGAAYQSLFQCCVCGEKTEQTVHCSKPAILVKGIRWWSNDAVNFAAVSSGSVSAMLLYMIVTGLNIY